MVWGDNMTPVITFRPAIKADLAEILTFPQDKTELFYFFPSATYPLTLEQLETQLSERHESTVMLQNSLLQEKGIIGFANFYNVENRNIAFIGNIIIRPDKRAQGLGRKLVQTMIISGFKRFNLNEVHLSCYKQNRSALLFYKQLGFKPYAIETRQDLNNLATDLIHLKVKKSYFFDKKS